MGNQNDDLYEEMFQMARMLLDRGEPTEVLEKYLNQKTEDIVLIAVVIKEAKNDYYATRRKEGLAKIVVGVFVVLAGFILTFCNYHSNKSIELVMYGFTSVGISVVGWGLYKLVG